MIYTLNRTRSSDDCYICGKDQCLVKIVFDSDEYNSKKNICLCDECREMLEKTLYRCYDKKCGNCIWFGRECFFLDGEVEDKENQNSEACHNHEYKNNKRIISS